MLISTKGRYALRLMLDVALNSGDGPVPLRDIAQRQDLSDKYLEQLVIPLSRAGLVKSVRGASGGYLLTKDAGDYTVGEILRALEGDLAPTSCTEDGHCCENADRCVSHEVWEKIQSAVDGVVDHITLADMVRRYHEIEEQA